MNREEEFLREIVKNHKIVKTHYRTNLTNGKKMLVVVFMDDAYQEMDSVAFFELSDEYDIFAIPESEFCHNFFCCEIEDCRCPCHNE